MKNNDFDLSLLSPERLSGGIVGLISTSGWAVAAITLIVAALVTFTEVGFVGGINEGITATVIVLLFASYLIYFSMESAGIRDGMKCEEYENALEEYKLAKEPISPSDVYPLREFCRDYAERELTFRREIRLMRYGLTLADFDKFLKGEYSGAGTRIMRSVSKMKPRRLTPQMLLSFEGGEEELASPTAKRAFTTLSKLLPATVCTFFTGGVVLAMRDNLTASAIIEGIVKLSALPVIAIKGYGAGYGYAKSSLSAWLNTKSKLLKSFVMKKNGRVSEAEVS